jgi:hypothetical protein
MDSNRVTLPTTLPESQPEPDLFPALADPIQSPRLLGAAGFFMPGDGARYLPSPRMIARRTRQRPQDAPRAWEPPSASPAAYNALPHRCCDYGDGWLLYQKSSCKKKSDKRVNVRRDVVIHSCL